MCILSQMYKPAIGIYIVRDAFIHNFGPTLAWWVIILMELATLVVIDLAVQSVRRVYFPNDVDLMQRLEKDAAKASRRKFAAAEKGQVEVVELEQIDNGTVIENGQKDQNQTGYESYNGNGASHKQLQPQPTHQGSNGRTTRHVDDHAY